jgi:hypothetical protein
LGIVFTFECMEQELNSFIIPGSFISLNRLLKYAMRSSIRFSIWLFFFMLAVVSCEPKSNLGNKQEHFSSMDVGSIPLLAREKEFEKGNLLQNPSFESGRNYLADTVKLSFNIPGWKKVGENVIWTNTENLAHFEPNDASSGIHAIKITRKMADETDVQGEGIISDYIRIIPGNYQLKMDIRLKHIESNMERMVSGLFDAINLKIFFYDRNKILIKSNALHPLISSQIDNSFKGFSFSGFEYIDEMDWTKIIARSGNFPFEEGNVPDNARYVKIFAGLKGTGEMWVDMIDFRYSKHNFTLLEKVLPYIDSTLEKSAYLTPTPQIIGKAQKINLYSKIDEKKISSPLFLLSVNEGKYTRVELNNLISKLRQEGLYARKENPLITKLPVNALESDRLIFSFGNTLLSNQFADQLPFEEINDKEQAYFIKNIDTPSNIIFVGYSDKEGLYRALNSISSLLEVKDSLYYHYDIVDYPDFLNRAVIVPVEKETNPGSDNSLKYLEETGFNNFVFEPRDPELTVLNYNSLLAPKNKIIASYHNTDSPFKFGYSFCDLKLQINKLDMENPDLASQTKKVFPDETEKLATLIKKLQSSDPDLFLFSDKNLWNCLNISLSQKSLRMIDKKSFDQYIVLRNSFWQNLNNQMEFDKTCSGYLIPIVSNNRTLNQISFSGYEYFKDLSLFPNVFNSLLWSGPVNYSTLIDGLDLMRFSSVASMPLTLIDNTLTGRKDDVFLGGYASRFHGKTLAGILFEPYFVDFAGINSYDFHGQIIVNSSNLSDLTQIRLATAADYYWNVSAYDPYISVWKILVNKYGQESALELIYFNDLFFKLVALNMQIKNDGYSQKLAKTGEELRNLLDEHWKKITLALAADISFLDELSNYKNHVISRFYQSIKESDAKP